MPHRDVTLMYRDVTERERESLESQALRTLHCARSRDLEAGVSMLDQAPRDSDLPDMDDSALDVSSLLPDEEADEENGIGSAGIVTSMYSSNHVTAHTHEDVY